MIFGKGGGGSSIDSYADIPSLPASASDGALALLEDTGQVVAYNAALGWVPYHLWERLDGGMVPALWLEARHITGLSDGAAVGDWSDVSGNGRHYTASGGDRPLYRSTTGVGSANLPYVEFDGTVHKMTQAAGLDILRNVGRMTGWYVVRFRVPAAGDYLHSIRGGLAGNANDTRWLAYGDALRNISIWGKHNDSQAPDFLTGGEQSAGWHVVEIERDYINRTAYVLDRVTNTGRVDQDDREYSTKTGWNGTAGSATQDTDSVGAYLGADDNLGLKAAAADLAAVVMLEDATDADRIAVRAHLRGYGL